MDSNTIEVNACSVLSSPTSGGGGGGKSWRPSSPPVTGNNSTGHDILFSPLGGGGKDGGFANTPNAIGVSYPEKRSPTAQERFGVELNEVNAGGRNTKDAEENPNQIAEAVPCSTPHTSETPNQQTEKNGTIKCRIPLSAFFFLVCGIILGGYTAIILLLTLSQRSAYTNAIHDQIDLSQQKANLTILEPLIRREAAMDLFATKMKNAPGRFIGGASTTVPDLADWFTDAQTFFTDPLTSRIFQFSQTNIPSPNDNGTHIFAAMMVPLARGATAYLGGVAMNYTVHGFLGYYSPAIYPYSREILEAITSPDTEYYDIKTDPSYATFRFPQESKWSATVYADVFAGGKLAFDFSYAIPLIFDDSDPQRPHRCTSAMWLSVFIENLVDRVIEARASPATTSLLVDYARQVYIASSETDFLGFDSEKKQLFSMLTIPHAKLRAIYRLATEHCPPKTCEFNRFDHKGDGEDGESVSGGKPSIISSMNIKTSTIHFLLVQSTPKEHFFGDWDRNLAIGIAVGCVCGAFVLACCVALWFVIWRNIETLKTVMMLAAEMRNAEAQTQSSASPSFLKEIGMIQNAFESMNQRLLLARPFLPQSLLVASLDLSRLDEDEEVDEDTDMSEDEDFNANNNATHRQDRTRVKHQQQPNFKALHANTTVKPEDDDDETDEGDLATSALEDDASGSANGMGGASPPNRHLGSFRSSGRGRNHIIGVDNNALSMMRRGGAENATFEVELGSGNEDASSSILHGSSNAAQSPPKPKRRDSDKMSSSNRRTAAAIVSAGVKIASQHAIAAAANVVTANSSGLVQRTVAVVSINVRNFHDFLRNNTPLATKNAHNALASIIEKRTVAERGIVDSLHGDRFILTFNVARVASRVGHRAANTALLIVEEVEQRNCVFGASQRHPLSIGVSCARGVYVGALGTDTLKKISAVGRAFPDAVAMERCAKWIGTPIVAGERARNDLDQSIHSFFLGIAKVKPVASAASSLKKGGAAVGGGADTFYSAEINATQNAANPSVIELHGIMGRASIAGGGAESSAAGLGGGDQHQHQQDEWLYTLDAIGKSNPFAQLEQKIQEGIAAAVSRRQQQRTADDPMSDNGNHATHGGDNSLLRHDNSLVLMAGGKTSSPAKLLLDSSLQESQRGGGGGGNAKGPPHATAPSTTVVTSLFVPPSMATEVAAHDAFSHPLNHLRHNIPTTDASGGYPAADGKDDSDAKLVSLSHSTSANTSFNNLRPGKVGTPTTTTTTSVVAAQPQQQQHPFAVPMIITSPMAHIHDLPPPMPRLMDSGVNNQNNNHVTVNGVSVSTLTPRQQHQTQTPQNNSIMPKVKSNVNVLGNSSNNNANTMMVFPEYDPTSVVGEANPFTPSAAVGISTRSLEWAARRAKDIVAFGAIPSYDVSR